MPRLRLSFDLRRPAFARASTAELCAAMLDICEWADALGFDLLYFGEHHCADDGYLPSPLNASAAVAGRTRHLRLRPILLTPLYHPLRLAEDIAVVDLLSGGRLTPVFAAGYRAAEFDMLGVELTERRSRVIEAIEVCKQAWTGEPFEFQGRTVRVTPTPAQHPRPPIIYGATADVAARRAAHIADGFDPGQPSAWEPYRQECRLLGHDPGPYVPRGPTFLFITQDPDAAWARVGQNLLHAANSYARWIAESSQGTSAWWPSISGVDELREGGVYRIVTPAECVAVAEDLGDDGHLILRPLFGGTEPETAWESLQLFEREVLPHLHVPQFASSTL